MSSNRFLSGSLTKGSKAHDIDIEGVTSGTVTNGGDVHANGHYVKTHDQYSQRMLFFPRSNSSDILYRGGSVNTEKFDDTFSSPVAKSKLEPQTAQWGLFQEIPAAEAITVISRKIDRDNPVENNTVDALTASVPQIYIRHNGPSGGTIVFNLRENAYASETDFQVSFDPIESTTTKFDPNNTGGLYETGFYKSVDLIDFFPDDPKKLSFQVNHRIEQRDLGQGSFYNNDVIYEDLDNLEKSPEIIVAASPYAEILPETMVDAGIFRDGDGVLEPLGVRTEIDLSLREIPFSTRGVKGSLGQEDVFKKSYTIVDGYNSNESPVTPFLDAIEYFVVGDFESENHKYDLTAPALYNTVGKKIYERGNILHAWYRFDQDVSTSGDLYDSSGNEFSLAPKSGSDTYRPEAPAIDTPSVKNKLFPQETTSFDQFSVLLGNNPAPQNLNGGFTISIWVKPTDLTFARAMVYMGAASTGYGEVALSLFISTSGRIDFDMYDAAREDVTSARSYIGTDSGTNYMIVDEWNHVVATYNGGNLTATPFDQLQRLYLNGVEVTNGQSGTGSGFVQMRLLNPTAPSLFAIGNNAEVTSDLYDVRGKIAEVAVWTEPFSAEEVANLYSIVQGPTFLTDKEEDRRKFSVELPPIFPEDEQKTPPFSDTNGHENVYFKNEAKTSSRVDPVITNAILSGTFGKFDEDDQDRYELYGSRGRDYLGGKTDSIVYGGLLK